jgi:hypothetical protein
MAKPWPKTTLATRAALSVDSHECTLEYLRHLPEVGRQIAAMADDEEVLVEKLQRLLGDLKRMRAKAHAAAWERWTEDEIESAVGAAKEGTK